MALALWRPVFIETFHLPNSLPRSSWVIVELGNSRCGEVQEGWLWRSYQIPPTGYLCASNALEVGSFQRFYVMEQPQGPERQLRYGQSIHSGQTIHLSQACEVTAVAFFYGEQKEAASGAAMEALVKMHPECNGN